MTQAPAQHFLGGTAEPITDDDATPHAVPAEALGGGDACRGDLFGRFVSVYQNSDSLSTELKSIDQKLAGARAYLGSAGSNPVLAHARLDQLKTRHTAVLTRLRANRHQARALLARTDSSFKPGVA